MIRTNSSGFTRVELVIVASVMSFMAAFAIPRFTSIENQGRVAAVASLTNSIRNASALAHALWLASGRPEAVDVDGRSISMRNGYPDAAADGLPGALADIAGFSAQVEAGSVVFRKHGAPLPENCAVVYSPATLDSPPRILLQTPNLSGC
jgi:MSHA pilin protein MshA